MFQNQQGPVKLASSSPTDIMITILALFFIIQNTMVQILVELVVNIISNATIQNDCGNQLF